MFRIIQTTFLSKLSKKEKALLSIAALVVFVLLLDRVIFRPILNKLKDLDTEIQNQKNTIKENLHITGQKDKTDKDIERYSSYIGKGQSSEKEMASLLQEIENLAAKFSISLIDIKPGGLEDEEIIKKYRVDLNCEARMEQIINFIYEVETFSALLVVEKFDIRPKTKNSDILKFTMSIYKVIIP